MKENDFYNLVEEMRLTQNLYFKTRKPEVLNRSKGLEKKVDQAIINKKIGQEKLDF